MANAHNTRKVRSAQAAVVGMRQVMQDLEYRNDPVFKQAITDVHSLGTDMVSMLALGLARFIGADEQVIEDPVTMLNYRGRIGAPLPWSKALYTDFVEARVLFARNLLTPEEFSRARALIEKLERIQRQPAFDFAVTAIDPLQETLEF